MLGLLIGHDAAVAEWAFRVHGLTPSKFDHAIGLMDEAQMLRGAILFQGFNGHNVELSYYGRRTMTLGVVRSIARMTLSLGVSRVTTCASKKLTRHIRGLERLGFQREAVMRRYYGPTDSKVHTAVRLVMFRDRIEKLADLGQKKIKTSEGSPRAAVTTPRLQSVLH